MKNYLLFFICLFCILGKSMGQRHAFGLVGKYSIDRDSTNIDAYIYDEVKQCVVNAVYTRIGNLWGVGAAHSGGGTILIDNKYDTLWLDSNNSNFNFIAIQDNKYSLFRYYNDFVEEGVCDMITSKPGGLYYFKNNGQWSAQKFGKEILSSSYDTLTHASKSGIVASKNGKYGVVDFDENVVLDFIYDDINYFEEGKPAVVKYKNVWGNLIDGKFIANGKNTVYINPDTFALYKGCTESTIDYRELTICSYKTMSKLFYENLEFPKEYFIDHKERNMDLVVTISEKGKLVGLDVDQEEKDSFSKAVLKAAKHLKDWKPAIYNGVPVKSTFDIRVSFNESILKHYKKQ